MSAVRGVPPGRAGRTWLAGRLQASRRAGDLLDRKLRILRRERARAAHHAEQAQRRWVDALRDARQWGLRARLLSAPPAAGVARAARVDVQWGAVMGARYPTGVRVTHDDDPGEPLPLSAAATCATRAAVEAVSRAAEAAAARGALAAVDHEIAVTRLRWRAIEHSWVPRLQQQAEALDLALAENETTEAVLRKLASGGPNHD
ncbi:MAG TPA: V-type ATP synthase subunit D [Angustibacter sp.]|nr:V-type ATP synthase subunit D [Angustibacter sp.]